MSFGDDDRLVLLRAAHELVTAPFSESLDEDVEHLAFVFLVALGGDLCLQVDKLVEPSYLLFLRDVVGQMLGGIGSRALRVFEHEGSVEPHFFHQ